MNNKKPDSLFQSMEKWIDLYRELHECSHNEAHDAFEAWAEALRGDSADQTTTSFHEAVKASYQEMLAAAPKEETALIAPSKVVDRVAFGDHRVITASIGERTEVGGVSFRPVTFTASGEESLSTRRDVLLDPMARHPGPRPTIDMSVTGMPGLPVRELVGGPLLETGQDPLAFKHGESFQPSLRMITTPAELRVNLEKAISDANKYLDELGDVAHPSDLAQAKEIKDLAEGRLKMLEEVEAREKERSGKRLTLTRK